MRSNWRKNGALETDVQAQKIHFYWILLIAGAIEAIRQTPTMTMEPKMIWAYWTPSQAAVNPAAVAPSVITDLSRLISAITLPRISDGAESSRMEFAKVLKGVWNIPTKMIRAIESGTIVR